MIRQSFNDGKEAKMFLLQALSIFRELNNENKIGDTLAALGNVERKSGNLLAAEKHLDDAFEIFTKNENEKELSLTIYQMGRLEFVKGNILESQNHHLHSLDIASNLIVFQE